MTGVRPDLHALLRLAQVEDSVWRSVTPDTNYGGEVFGGQYLGLSVSAAMLSAPERMPHAMTGYFLRGARAEKPVDYHVECTRDGRSFVHRRVSALQDGREVFRAEVSFHEWEDGQPAHAEPAPTIPPMEQLPSLAQLVTAQRDTLDPVTIGRVLNRDSFATHFVDAEEGLGAPGLRPQTRCWVVPRPAPLAGDAVGYYATLAYLTDACANFACRTMHASSLHDGSLMSASLNHAIWFHALPCPVERVAYALVSPFAGGGLGFNRGEMHAADGRILASVVQEALIRRPGAGRQ